VNNKSKFLPLLLIFVLSLGPLTIAPTAAASGYAPTIYSSNAPWIPDSSKYASYNGHFSSSHTDSLHPVGNNTDVIVVADLTVNTISASYSNLSLVLREFFTKGQIPVSGLWYKLDTSNGKVADSSGHNSSLNGAPCFFFLPTATSLKLNNKVSISTPFYGKPLIFTVNRTETVLGIQTIQLLNSTYLYWDGGSHSEWLDINVALWISNDSNGLLMRIKGSSTDDWSDSGGYGHSRVDVSMQVYQTNILTLTLPPMPSTQAVPWMKPGRSIQYNLQGSGFIDPKIGNETGNAVWQLPGDTKFRVTVSSNITMKVERATTGYVDPWGSTRWIWVVHLMLNNTKILLPDFWRSVNYVNTTFHLNIPLTEVNSLLSNIAQFNKTGLVAETYFLVDNATGVMFAPGMTILPPETFNATKYDLGTWLQRGYAFLVLQYVGQTYLTESWSQGGSFPMHQSSWINANVTQTEDVSVNASVKVIGTEYLTFPGGGGGNCWKLADSINGSISMIQLYNRTVHNVGGINYGPPDYSAQNVTAIVHNTGYIDIERFSGFPLAFQQHLTGSFSGKLFTGMRSSVPQTLNWTVGFGLDLSALVPRSDIMWVSFPTVNLILGAGNNATMPPGYFRQYGFHVTMNNATNVDVTGSAEPPPDTGNPPSGTQSFIYLSIHGEFLPGANVVTLYVFVNRSLVLGLGIDEYSLRLYTWNSTGSKWSELVDPNGHPASHYVYINATHGCIVGYLYHLSYFAVLGSPSTPGGPSTTLILIAAVAIIAVVAVVVLLRRRKGGIK
jgi:hypothetical protein